MASQPSLDLSFWFELVAWILLVAIGLAGIAANLLVLVTIRFVCQDAGCIINSNRAKVREVPADHGKHLCSKPLCGRLALQHHWLAHHDFHLPLGHY